MWMFANVVAQTTLAKLKDGRRERRVPGGARTFTSELAKRAVDDGESWSVGFHKLGPQCQQVGYTWATINFVRFRPYFAST